MTHTEFFAQVKKGEIARAYLFEGEEEYVKERALETLRQKLLPEGLEALNETTLQNPAAGQLIECAEMVPVMAEKRLVVANECAYVANSKAAGDSDGAERLTKYLDTLHRLLRQGAGRRAQKAFAGAEEKGRGRAVRPADGRGAE